MNHQDILEKILFEKKLSKRELARKLGYSEQNSSNIFNKAEYSEKVKQKIIEGLGLYPSVFDDESSMMAMETVNDYKAMTTIPEVEILKKQVEILMIQYKVLEDRVIAQARDIEVLKNK